PRQYRDPPRRGPPRSGRRQRRSAARNGVHLSSGDQDRLAAEPPEPPDPQWPGAPGPGSWSAAGGHAPRGAGLCPAWYYACSSSSPPSPPAATRGVGNNRAASTVTPSCFMNNDAPLQGSSQGSSAPAQ